MWSRVAHTARLGLRVNAHIYCSPVGGELFKSPSAGRFWGFFVSCRVVEWKRISVLHD